MARRWYNEDYRKLYTRQDAAWLKLSFCARGLADHLLRYAALDGSVLTLEPGEDLADELARTLSAKANERRIVKDSLDALIKDGYLVLDGHRLVIRNFVAAQERLSQEAARQRRKRDRDAAEPVTNQPGSGDIQRDHGVTGIVTNGTNVTPNVTPKFAVSGRVGSGRVEKDPPVAPQGAAAPSPAAQVGEAHLAARPPDATHEGGAAAAGGELDLGSARPSVEKLVRAHLDDALRVLAALNAARKRVRPATRGIAPTYESLIGIAGRLHAGRTVEDCLRVIAHGERECTTSNDPDTSWKFFNATTPWRPENFQLRLDAAPEHVDLGRLDVAAPAAASPTPAAKRLMPNGQPWPGEVQRATRGLTDAEHAEWIARRRREEPMRFDAEGNAIF
jgi:hypothetical protein